MYVVDCVVDVDDITMTLRVMVLSFALLMGVFGGADVGVVVVVVVAVRRRRRRSSSSSRSSRSSRSLVVEVHCGSRRSRRA